MRGKPLLTLAGAVLSGVILSGCEFGRSYYDGPRGYGASLQTGGSQFAQNSTYYVPSRPAPVTGALAMKPESPGPLEVNTSLQLVSGSSPAAGPQPMLTISIPAVKFLVPMNGTFTYVPPQGTPAAATPAPEAVPMPPPPPAPPTSDHEVLRANTQTVTPTAPFAPPTLQTVMPSQTTPPPPAAANPVPTLPNPAPASPITPTTAASPAPAPQPVGASVQYLPPITPPTPARQEETLPAVPAPPPPVWPKAPGEAGEEQSAPPPPPPIHRTSTLMPAPAGRPNPYYP